MTRPLDGILVVSVEQAVSAPFATRQLADLGARVVKVERPPDGDFARRYDDVVNGMSTYFVWLNRNKESLGIDVKTPAGAMVLERLLERADVFVQNLSPPAASRLGLTAADVVARHPRVVACNISGFGPGGPYSNHRAYDLVIQAEAGSISVTGWPDAPAKPGIALADIGSGMYAFSSILAGLYARERTGHGAAIEVSMFDTVVEWMGYSTYYAAHAGQPHLPNGVGHPALCPYAAFRSVDGEDFVMAVQNDDEWQRLAVDVLDRPDLAAEDALRSNVGRVANRERVTAACAAALETLTRSEAATRLTAAGIANGRLNDVFDVLDHPQLAARDRWRDVGTPAGSVRAVLPPPTCSDWLPRMDPVPALGEHTDAILRELDITDGGVGDQ